MTTCPNGHDSTWPDWCSTCGERLAGADAAGAVGSAGAAGSAELPSPTAAGRESQPTVVEGGQQTNAATAGPTCDNCRVERRPDDVFCESCGYDFASGSLPESEAGTDQVGGSATPVHVRVQVDPTFFEASVGQVDLHLPDPIPEAATVPLAGIRILIGRHSTSRGVFPEVDVLALTGDPAVSSRHAMLERSPDGSWTLTDLGSTNGTFLSSDAIEALAAGVATPVVTGTSIYVGAWTRIDLAETVS